MLQGGNGNPRCSATLQALLGIMLLMPSSSPALTQAWSSNSWSHRPLPSSEDMPVSRRRQLLASISGMSVVVMLTTPVVVGAVGAVPESNAVVAEIDQLPMILRDFTKLAPLGPAMSQQRQEAAHGGGGVDKTANLSLDQIAAILTRDLTLGATGKGGYIISGDLTGAIFRNDCVFVDPTNRVKSLGQYQQALRILFDPKSSIVELIEPLVVNEKERTISGRFRSRGFLQLPWHPYVTAYESTIVYRIDDSGLIKEQLQNWTKSSSTALKETFTPTIFTPPISSCARAALPNEPIAVTRLFHHVNGRRKDEYSVQERREIDALIQEIASMRQQRNDAATLAGKWMLVYLQPGPDGAGIDRRIPFPEFAFNDNYQIFGDGDHSVTNIGELFGPPLYVKVFGKVQQQSDNNKSSGPPYTRYQALIQGGKLCFRKEAACLDLPIQGEGLFDSVYLGDRLRIGQNLNGGGARVVQVRVD